MRALIALVLVAGCGSGNFFGADDDGQGTCGTAIDITPSMPVVGEQVQATGRTALDSPRYTWQVGAGDGPGDSTDPDSTLAFQTSADQSTIQFVPDHDGAYYVRLTASDGGASCEPVIRTISVAAPGDRTMFVRLRAVPPQRVAAPPIDRVISIGAAGLELGVVIVDPGTRMTTSVTGPGGVGVPAYVRFSPNGTPDAVVEAFSGAGGGLIASLSTQPHTVLVVPSQPGLAPRVFTAWSATAPTPLALDAGTAVHGTVRDPDGAALPGATVQLAIDGVPSTVATTDAAGVFTVRVSTVTGTTTVSVAPPVASGLPRLTATGVLALAGEVQIGYASLARKDLAGTVVRRAGQPVARAQVVIVGVIANAGTIVAGATLSANGEVRLPITAGANGALPAALAPATLVSAVVTVGPGDLAITGIDLAAAVPPVIDAAAMTTTASAVQAASGLGLPGTMIDVVPLGILALADAPALHLVAGPDGAFSVALPATGRFDLRFRDPAARAAPQVVRDLTGATMHGAYPLPKALMISGMLQLGTAGPLGGGSVQILCQDCTGLERSKPIAEVAADDAGRFRLAVPAPGTR